MEIGKIYYWQDGGWHGLSQIVRFTDRFIYYTDYPKTIDKPSRKTIKNFNKSHSCYSYNCEYAYTYKEDIIGSIQSL